MTDEPALLLNDPYERDRRRSMLNLPHIKPVTDFVAALRKDGYGEVPDIDPLDGGVKARILFLLEKPGKQGSGASGFVSRDNKSQSAKTMRRFMHDAGIAREDTVLWNVVPGWNGTPAIRVGEMTRGLAAVDRLMDILPALQVLVCVGKRAQAAADLAHRRGLACFMSYHPSPNNFAAAYAKWLEIPHEWRKAQEYLERTTLASAP